MAEFERIVRKTSSLLQLIIIVIICAIEMRRCNIPIVEFLKIGNKELERNNVIKKKQTFRCFSSCDKINIYIYIFQRTMKQINEGTPIPCKLMRDLYVYHRFTFAETVKFNRVYPFLLYIRSRDGERSFFGSWRILSFTKGGKEKERKNKLGNGDESFRSSPHLGS